MLEALTPSQIIEYYGLKELAPNSAVQYIRTTIAKLTKTTQKALSQTTILKYVVSHFIRHQAYLIPPSQESIRPPGRWYITQTQVLLRQISAVVGILLRKFQISLGRAFKLMANVTWGAAILCLRILSGGLFFTCAYIMTVVLDGAQISARIIKHIYRYLKTGGQRFFTTSPIQTLALKRHLAHLPGFARQIRLLPRISLGLRKKIGIALIIVAFGGVVSAAFPFVGLEFNYALLTTKQAFIDSVASHAIIPLPTPTPNLAQNPLIDPNGNLIIPANSDFAIIIPKIGVNAPVIPGVNPGDTKGYEDALKKGVAHANTSFYPNENGTVYLFSHSTNYEWFVKDLNAVFFLLKNLKEGDIVVVMYLGNRYTYRIRETRVVSTAEVSYLSPQTGKRNLILQTCWPPGTAWKRLLIFADLVSEQVNTGFGNLVS